MTVEKSLSITMRDFRKRLYPHSSGTFKWAWLGDHETSVGYSVTWDGSGPTVALRYRWHNDEEVEIPVRLQTTSTQFGGKR